MYQKFHSSINHSSLVTLYLFIIPILFSEYKNIVLLLQDENIFRIFGQY